MNRSFAGVVEDVQRLSFDEKLELADLLELYLIEEKRQRFLENGELSRREQKDGGLKFYSDTDELITALND